jgi:cell division protein FtsW
MFFGANYNQADRWLMIPIINQTFQTSDLAKLALIMYLARVISLKGEEIKDYKNGFLMILAPVIVVCGLIFRADFSTSIALLTSSLILMFIGGARILHILSVIGGGIVVLAFVFTIAKVNPGLFDRAPTWEKRINSFFNPSEVGKNANHQTNQAKIAIAAGGVIGKGPGKSTQRNFLPHPYSDFIYAIIIEEYGLFGGVFVIILYLILLFRSIKIATSCDKKFGAYLAMGICVMLVFQAIINMAVAVNLFPVTGQTLPMISMGGTSIWFTCLAVGVILSVSVKEEKNKNKVKPNLSYAN